MRLSWLLFCTLWIGTNVAAAATNHSASIAVRNNQPVLYVLFGNGNSHKWNRQFQLFTDRTDDLTRLHLICVPIAYEFLTMGMPPGMDYLGVAGDAERKRFGWRKGKQEFLLVLVDTHDRVKLRSFDPVTVDQLAVALKSRVYRRSR